MDIDIGNLVYIAFVVIILVLNMISKSKKKAQQSRPTEQDSNEGRPVKVDPRKSFEELLQEFTQPEAEAPVIVEEKPEPKAAPKPVAYNKYQSVGAKPMTRPKKEHSIMTTEYGKFEEFEEQEVEVSDLNETFSNLNGARKAFIYTEIFNRKY